MSAPSRYELLLAVLKQKAVDEAKEKRDIREETLWLITVITVSRAGRIKDEKKIKERMTRKRRSVSRHMCCSEQKQSAAAYCNLRNVPYCLVMWEPEAPRQVSGSQHGSLFFQCPLYRLLQSLNVTIIRLQFYIHLVVLLSSLTEKIRETTAKGLPWPV